MQPELKPVRDIVVRYSSESLPLDVLERLQRENCDAFVADELRPADAFRVANLLLSIALMKLQAA